jgi:two-component system, LytTR family, response regulator
MTPLLKAIIVDDELNSLNALKNKLNRNCPQVSIVAECVTPEDGIREIDTLKPDIVFLDVEMPRMNGFIMLQRLTNRDFELIFTTAFDQYAIEAIRASALDYLVKPVEVEELTAAVDRAMRKRQQPAGAVRIETLLHNLLPGNATTKRIAIPSLEGYQFVDTDHILYLEAFSNYTLLFLQGNQKITVSRTLKDFEDLLPPDVFIRIHHSHIINKNQVSKYIKGEGGQVVMNNGKVLDVARRKKDDFLRAFDML